jgi:hypothetical protein
VKFSNIFGRLRIRSSGGIMWLLNLQVSDKARENLIYIKPMVYGCIYTCTCVLVVVYIEISCNIMVVLVSFHSLGRCFKKLVILESSRSVAIFLNFLYVNLF